MSAPLGAGGPARAGGGVVGVTGSTGAEVRGQRRRGRPRSAQRQGPWLGRELEVEVGPVAHGGHCVARHEGRVLFVRHTLPGERVVALVTEDGGGSYCRADAVRVLAASPDRVSPPCPHAGPGRCGGCDWQHATGAAQRAGKAAVVREQLARLARLPDVPVLVEPLPATRPAGADPAGDDPAGDDAAASAQDGLLGWRTRVRFAVGADGRTGLRRHRSHELEPVRHCPLGTDRVTAAGVGDRRWPGVAEVEVAPPPAATPRSSPTARWSTGPQRVREIAAGREWRAAATGFWQVHPAAADALAACALGFLRPRPGEAALDLYAGAGLFARLLADAVGPTGRVVAVEADPTAAADAEANLAGAAADVRVRRSRVTPGLLGGLGIRPQVVVLDPPRAGAGRDVMAALVRLAPRAVAYVACDPASFARDLRVALDAGWELRALRAFDCFPMTHHVETVALLGQPEERAR